jgi:hypothetical protein
MTNNIGTAKDQILDDQGTDQQQGQLILKKLRDNGFESDNEKLAIALGRPIDEVEGWIEGDEIVDDDVIMKARGIAKERGIEIE